VTIEVLDVSGRRVCTLTDGVQESGRYEVRWDGCDEAGREVSSGVYFYQLKAGKTVVSRKMILLK
jgi:flagellar hook assembly protein FlgD